MWKIRSCDSCGKVRSCQVFGSCSPNQVAICFICQKQADRAEAKAMKKLLQEADNYKAGKVKGGLV